MLSRLIDSIFVSSLVDALTGKPDSQGTRRSACNPPAAMIPRLSGYRDVRAPDLLKPVTARRY
jgi:hypothetical protein